jgi:glycosyltransferase involved in cell wall biosynthesis
MDKSGTVPALRKPWNSDSVNGISAGSGKRALVIAQSFSMEMNANRPLTAACVLSRLAAVDVVTTDFDHWTKKAKTKSQIAPIEEIIYLKTLPYRNNVSAGRLLSHLLFSLSAAWFFLKHRDRYNILYVTLPFNTLAWLVLRNARAQWKIVDVMDIWPDVLPFSRRQLKLFRPVFALWRRLFNRSARAADVMMAVSDSFFQEASKYVDENCKSRRFYLGEVNLQREVPKNSILTIAYSGNLGRLYDFETLLDVMTEAERGSLQLFIVGDGDRRDWLLSELTKRGLPHQYFGSVYDPVELGNILSRAHLGFNGFVNTSATFSTKASTYFAAGLPILNSMQGDLEKLVVQHELGFNYLGGDRESLRRCLSQLDATGLASMSQNCKRFFATELDRTKIREEMYVFLRECLES